MGTLGHNVMLWAEKDAYAVWMIAPTEHRHKVAEFFASTGQDLEADNGFVSPEVSLLLLENLVNPPTMHAGWLVYSNGHVHRSPPTS